MIPGLIIDSFAGGGGASTGIEWALGRSPDIAINHDGEALAMHAANHPRTIHLRENVWKVDPHHFTGDQPVALLWASPDCRHHSKAKGGKPVSKSVRGLADVVLVWARTVSPTVIFLENVEEFEDWGPLGDDDRPCPRRKGQEFRRWVRALEDLGYAVAWRQMRACDHGAPTIRKRLFLVARRDGKPILWPAATHGDPKSEAVRSGALKPWRTAAEIIDWSIACPSIFLTRDEARAQGLRIIRPLAEKTLARIARGFRRYVLDRPEPFIVFGGAASAPFMSYAQQGGASRPADAPLHTVTASRKDQNQIITPFLAVSRHDATGQVIDKPLPTITANSFIKRPGAGGPLALVTPYLAVSDIGIPLLDDAGLAGARRVAEFLRDQGMWTGGEVVTVGPFVVVDIGMRMLTPRELARAQGFPDDYILAAPLADIRLTETAQRHKIGNSVSPYPAAALVRANMIDAPARPDVRRKRASLPPVFVPPPADAPGLPFEARP